MRLEAHNKFGNPVNTEVTRVVIYDDFDNPISLALKFGTGLCYVAKIGDKEFDNILKMFGIDKTVIVNTIDVKALNSKMLPGKLLTKSDY